MTNTIFSDPVLNCEPSGPKVFLLEPLLTAGAAVFWLCALPFVAFSLMAVKIWDVLVALFMGHGLRPNPLILRRGPAKDASAEPRPQHAAQV